jgi:hypothetical protein
MEITMNYQLGLSNFGFGATNNALTGTMFNNSLAGLQPNAGLMGLTGTTSLTGMNGLTGLTGMNGLTGLTGMNGLTGMTGLSGLTGGPGLSTLGNYGTQPQPGAMGLAQASALMNNPQYAALQTTQDPMTGMLRPTTAQDLSNLINSATAKQTPGSATYGQPLTQQEQLATQFNQQLFQTTGQDFRTIASQAAMNPQMAGMMQQPLSSLMSNPALLGAAGLGNQANGTNPALDSLLKALGIDPNSAAGQAAKQAAGSGSCGSGGAKGGGEASKGSGGGSPSGSGAAPKSDAAAAKPAAAADATLEALKKQLSDMSAKYTALQKAMNGDKLNDADKAALGLESFDGKLKGDFDGKMIGEFDGDIKGNYDGKFDGDFNGTIEDGTVKGEFEGTIDGFVDELSIDGKADFSISGEDGKVVVEDGEFKFIGTYNGQEYTSDNPLALEEGQTYEGLIGQIIGEGELSIEDADIKGSFEGDIELDTDSEVKLDGELNGEINADVDADVNGEVKAEVDGEATGDFEGEVSADEVEGGEDADTGSDSGED